MWGAVNISGELLQIQVAHKKNRQLREMLSEKDEMTESLREELVRVQHELTQLLTQAQGHWRTKVRRRLSQSGELAIVRA